MPAYFSILFLLGSFLFCNCLFLIDNHGAFNSSQRDLIIRERRQANNLITVNEIARVFKLNERSAQTFVQKIRTSDMAMIYPSKALFEKLQRLVLSAQPRDPPLNKRLVYKFEVSSKVRIWWNKAKQTSLDVPRPGTPIDRINREWEPMEYYVQKLCAGIPFFIKFYKDHSFLIPRDRDGLYVYAIEKINRAQDLGKWYDSVRHLGINEVERQLKPHLRATYSGLMYLLYNNLVYTDLKPENILIDREADKAYLIDLESATTIVNPPYTHFLSTPWFFPMDNARILDANRILTWTFGQTIYRLLCAADNSRLNQLVVEWIKAAPYKKFIEYFGCPRNRGISRDLQDVINLLLTPQPNPRFLFSRDLISQFWFNS